MKLLIASFMLVSINSFAGDTLYFRLSNPWNTVKDPNGTYLRKCIKENDYYHVWDYNKNNILVTEGFYVDTAFKSKLFCHKYFNESKGYLEQTRCYDNGQLNGYMVDYNQKGDTVSYEILDHNNLIKSWSSEPDKDSQVFTAVESIGEFPGGNIAWINYLSENLKYPKQLKKQKISGNVVVRIYIGNTGLVNKVEVLQSLHPLLDLEVVRVIKNSPKWKPAIQNGKAVYMTFVQPISF